MSFNHKAYMMNKQSGRVRGLTQATNKKRPEVKVEKAPFRFKSKSEEKRSLEKFLRRLGLI